MRTQIITKLEELLSKSVSEVASEVRTLQKEYKELWQNDFEKARQAFTDEGGKSKEFVYVNNNDDETIAGLFEKFNQLKKEAENKIALEQQKNLSIRQEIIAKINDISKVSTNVGAAMKKLTELQTQWKETGQVSTHKYKEIQAEYSKAIENIFYNLKIFRELQEHDLKKNFELKKALIDKIKAIQLLENIKEAERLIKVYRNDWEDIGPVPNEKWEDLKLEYKSALDETYGKIKAYYNSMEELKESNLSAKRALIDKTKTLVQGEFKSVAAWNDVSAKIIEIQNEWKTIGRAGQKENEEVWNEFRALCDEFFAGKKEFFNNLHEQQGEVKSKKVLLIERAEMLQNSTDWQKTSQDLIRLQEEWKKYHLASERDESKLFFRFRKACNAFFDAKKAYHDAINATLDVNVKTREDIIVRINSYQWLEDNAENLKHLKEFSLNWNAAGQVPFKEKKRLNEAFYNRLDEYYERLNLNKAEKIMIQYKNKLERLINSDNAGELLKREADYLKKQMDEINTSIKKYENNMGFFKNAKSDNPLFKEVNEKIDAERNKLNDFTAKRKLVVEEMNKLRQTA